MDETDGKWNLELARSLSRFAREITPASMTLSDDLNLNAQRFWNVGFLIAARRLLDSIVVLTEAGLGPESSVQLRCLLELVGNLNYLNADNTRALQFAAAESVSRRRLSALIEKYGLGDAAEREQLAASIAEEVEKMTSLVGPDLENEALARRPFGVDARTRIESSPSMAWHYDLIYGRTSDVLHMNAAAVARYLREPEEETYAIVAMTNELVLRILYAVDGVLEMGRRGIIDGYTAQYAKRAFPERAPGDVIAHLRGASRASKA